jgi:hypothetical protein
MMIKQTTIILILCILLSTCHVFLGPDPDISPEAVLKSLWKDFNEMHAYIDIRMSYNKNFDSWDDVLNNKEKGYLRWLSSDMSGASLFYTCAAMLEELQDIHVGLFAPGHYYVFTSDPNSDVAKEERAFYLSDISHYYLKDRGIQNNTNFLYGTFSSDSYADIGYIHISALNVDGPKPENMDWAKKIDDIVKYFHDNNVKALIIDVRNNSGGLGQTAEYIAARFASVQKNFMKSHEKNGPGRNDFSDPVIHRVNPAGTRYTKPVALLTNKASVSAAEWFLMAMRTQSHVTHLGTTTRGAFSSRTTRSMINGWYYTISAERVTDMDGIVYEGIGISPYTVLTGYLDEGEQAIEHPDRQLERALEEIEKWLSP